MHTKTITLNYLTAQDIIDLVKRIYNIDVTKEKLRVSENLDFWEDGRKVTNISGFVDNYADNQLNKFKLDPNNATLWLYAFLEFACSQCLLEKGTYLVDLNVLTA